MIIEGIKSLVTHINLVGFSINLGVVGLNFAGGSSYINKEENNV